MNSCIEPIDSHIKKALTISGWGQNPEALKEIIPPGMKIQPVDYMTMSERDFWNNLGHIANADITIGWSLGGQLAVRAVANKILRTKLLVLLAVPFSFEGGGSYQEAKKYFSLSPKEMLRGYSDFCMEGDNSGNTIPFYDVPLSYMALLADWLGILEGFDCSNLNFSDFPKTVIIHGKNDAVIPFSQAEEFSWRIHDSELLQWEGCGHAPHVHNPERCRRAIIAAMRG